MPEEEGKHHTNCTKCAVTCHENCKLPFSEKGHDITECEINLDKDEKEYTGVCNFCECSIDLHIHANNSYIVKPKKTEKYKSLLEDKKALKDGTYHK